MDEKIQKDRIRGSLIGGAIGDALGYPVEFIDSYAGIQRKYGTQELPALTPSNGGRAKTVPPERLGFLMIHK